MDSSIAAALFIRANLPNGSYASFLRQKNHSEKHHTKNLVTHELVIRATVNT